MTTRDAFKKKLTAELNESKAQISLLAAKVENAGADARVGYAKELDSLRDQQQQAADKLKEIEEASGDAWLKVKDGADKLWVDLTRGVASAIQRFR